MFPNDDYEGEDNGAQERAEGAAAEARIAAYGEEQARKSTIKRAYFEGADFDGSREFWDYLCDGSIDPDSHWPSV